MSDSTSQPPLEPVSVGELTHAQLKQIALDREPWATWMQPGGCLGSAHLEMVDLLRAAIAADRAHGAPQRPNARDLTEFMVDGSDYLPDPDKADAALVWARAMVASHLGVTIPNTPPHNIRQALLLVAACRLLTSDENRDQWGSRDLPPPVVEADPTPAAAEAPLWRVMKKAWETATTDYNGRYAAEICAVADRVVKEEEEPILGHNPSQDDVIIHAMWVQRHYIRALLLMEAAKAERG
jgi:hypothetical protein